MALKKVAEHEGWEIVESGPDSFSIRKAGQAIGPFASLEEVKNAINHEESRNLPRDQT